MNYSYNNKSDETNDQVEMSQRQRPDMEGPDREREREQRRQEPGFPGRPPQGPGEGFPGGPPEGLPPGFQVRPPQGPPPNIPGGMPPMPPTQEEQRTFRTGQPEFGHQGPGFPGPYFPFDPRGIRRCLYRFTYVWLNNGANFWFYPVYVAGNTVIGFRWRQRGWDYFTLNMRRIAYFRCF